MKSAPFLLLLLGLSPAVSQGQTESPFPHEDGVRRTDAPPGLSVLWDELLGLKELVLRLKAAEVEQRQAFRSMESRMRDGEVEAEKQRGKLDGLAEVSAEVLALQSRMNSSENSVEELKKRNTALAAELPFLQTRLRWSESTVEQLRRKSTVLAVRLCNTESLTEELMKQTSAFPASNGSSPSEASELERRLNVHLKEINTNTQVFYRRLNSMEEKLNASSEKHQLTFIQDQTSRLRFVERRVEELKTENTVLTDRLRVGERQLDELQIQTTVQADKMKQLHTDRTELETRLSVFEKQFENLRTENTVQSAELSLMESRLTNSHNSTTALEARLRSTEIQMEQLDNHTAVLEVRLSASQKQLEDLKTENTVQSIQLSAMESSLTDTHSNITGLQVRLRSTEAQLEQLDNHTAVLEVRLGSSEKQLEDVKTENTVHEAELSAVALRLNITEEQLETLRTRNTDRLTAAERETEELQVRLRAGEASINQLKMEKEAPSALLTEITSRLEAAESHASVLQSRLNRTDNLLKRHIEAQVDEVSSLSDAMSAIKDQSDVQSAQLSLMKSRLTDGHNNATDLEIRLRASEKQLEDLRTENTVFSFRLNETDDRLQKLTNTDSDELKVAFSAGLTDSGSVGPFDEETTLIFSKTITNVGQAYDQTAGVFTAPVRGLYFFSFTAADYLKGYMGVYLYRNNQPIIFNLDLNDHGGYASMSNGVALLLEEGDQIRLSLPATYRLYDDSRNFSIFSGFLLFPL